MFLSRSNYSGTECIENDISCHKRLRCQCQSQEIRFVPRNFCELSVFYPTVKKSSVLIGCNREIRNFLKQRTPIIIPRDYTATDLEEEHRLAYFREDVGINLHHWHWHLVYPFVGRPGDDNSIVNKDRRGELFFYMHQQIIARYVHS